LSSGAPALEQDAVYHDTLDGLLAASDVFVVAAPGAPELKGILDRERIGRMPANGVVVNISRGDLIDDDALIAALQSKRLFGAGLDVFANEPAIDPRYRALDNVFLTPHIGSATHETRDAMGWLLIRGLEALAAGKVPDNLLSPRRGEGLPHSLQGTA
jgi:lactate dehydrogenase-like 2-hydroxyacid dehydrogenase